MANCDSKYVTGKQRPGAYLLFKRKWVDRTFYEMVRGMVGDIGWTEDFDPAVTAAELCGRDCWESHSPLQHQLIGMCVSHLVYMGVLDLVKVNPKGKTPNRYKHRMWLISREIK